jgi:hypothetical protein
MIHSYALTLGAELISPTTRTPKGVVKSDPSHISGLGAYFFMRFLFGSQSQVLLGDIRYSTVAPPGDRKLINFQYFFRVFTVSHNFCKP